jgi:2-polyprenyl-3-methyl-5-hydroxy-6-metoxy-1,4-benzoquinol methylase
MNTNDLDKIAVSYHLNNSIDDKFIEEISQIYFCDWILNSFNKELRCCEMGLGDGITALRLHEHFDSYSVVEGSNFLIEQSKSTLPNVNLIHSFFEDFHPDNKFDLILALHVLEHVDEPAEILKIIKSWLTPSGKVIILVPNKNSLHRIFAKGMGIISNLDDLSSRDLQVGHKRVYDFDSLESDLEFSEFQIDEKKGFFLKTLSNGMMINFDKSLIEEFNKASSYLPAEFMANICVVASNGAP